MRDFIKLRNIGKFAMFIFVLALFTISCSDDEPGWADERYTSNFEFYFENINPKTGELFTPEELDELAWDPAEEGKYEEGEAINLKFVLPKQVSSLMITQALERIEILNVTSAEPEGDKFKISISTTLTELGLLEVKDETILKFDFVYADGAIGSAQYPVIFYAPPPPPVAASDLPALIGPKAYAIKGYWKFDDASDLTKATIGTALELIGTDEAVEGVVAGDGATLLTSGSGYSVLHGLPAVGGAQLNTYSIVYDIKAPAVDTYINLLQNDPLNSKDGTLYIKPNAGFWLNGLDDSPGDLVQADTWHRIVITLNGGVFTIYVDGALVHSVSGVAADSYFAPQLSNFNVFIDDNGEDADINCSSLILLDEALTGSEVALLPSVSEPAYKDVRDDIAGRWKFDDASDLSKATAGIALELIGSDTAVEGVVAGDGATLLTSGSGYSVIHGLPAVGGAQLNTYSIVYDIKAPAVDTYINLLQNDPLNSKDGTLYIKPNAGFWLNGLDDSPGDLVQADTWHRIVITLNAGVFTIYVDGALVHSVSGVAADSYFAPQLSNFNVFIDDNGEDADINCTDLILLKSALTATDVSVLPPVDIPAF